MVISHNMKAMNADRQLGIVTSDKTKSAEKLSSGYQINRAADDAAGLSISEKMRHQIRGLYRGADNIEEGIGYCQVADGALNEMQDMLQRMNELCIQAANGTLSNTDRGYIDDEVQALKTEIDRICRTTKFNEEYIFRCDDAIPEEIHDVYELTFSGRPKDLFIYNSSYDVDDQYAGVAFRGRRYTWDEISPNMYDETNHEFREGIYSIRADDGTVLTLVCENGAKLPQVSRQFKTSADGRGIYVNDDLVTWDKVKVAGDKYSFDYHGMTISYTRDADDTFEDMMLKMTGTVWESTYETPVASRSVDAQFQSWITYNFMNNTRIKEYLNGKNTKYILHAVDINQGGTIPRYDANGNFLKNEPFDGIWLEGTDDDWTANNHALWEMTWEDFGFDCGEDNFDWGNQSTDIWSGAGSIKDDPRTTYPPDSTYAGTSYSPGNTIFANYDPYNPFNFTNTGDQREKVNFFFSVINEVSKEQAVKAFNNVRIYYPAITPDNSGVMHLQAGHSNVKSAQVTSTGNLLTLSEEYYLGRDYENGQASYEFQGPAQMTYNNGAFSILYTNSSRGAFTKTFTMTSSQVNSRISALAQDQKDYFVQNNKIDTLETIALSLGNMSLSYTYDISGFGNATIQATENNSGRYVQMPDGTYQKYSYYILAHQGLQRYNIDLIGNGNQTIEDYFRNTVFPDIAAATKIGLQTDAYPKGTLTAEENKVSAMVTRWQTPFQHEHIMPTEPPEEKPEYLRIQCSSNTVDNIYIQKQKLSVYRLGLSNVGTLSEMQATGCIDMVGNALAKLSSVRSLFGAYQNRLECAYDINRNTHENTQRAESEIRDTDMAKEMIRYSNANILQQSGNSMLVQANQSNQGVLTLLQ